MSSNVSTTSPATSVAPAEPWPIDFIEGLGRLEASCEGVGTTDKVIALVQACLANGVTEGPRIVAAIAELGFKPQFVGMTLAKNRGADPSRHFWQRDKDGRYHCHEQAPATG
jgi:hypothetical protein